MGENESVIGVLKAIDDAIRDHPERRLDVARVLPPYRDPVTVGWYPEFERWVEQRVPTEVDFPTVEAALDEMVQRPPDLVGGEGGDEAAGIREAGEPRSGNGNGTESGPGALGSRRERVLIALVVALPGEYRPRSDAYGRVVEALQWVMPDRSRDEAEARLRDPARSSSLQSSYHSGLLLRPGDPGDPDDPDDHGEAHDPVPFFVTESQPMTGHHLGNIEELLDPLRWTDLAGELWGPMTRPEAPVGEARGSAQPRPLVDQVGVCLREEFKVTPAFTLRPVLQFIRRPLTSGTPAPGADTARALEYRLCPDHPHGDHDGLTHDAGAIVTRELGAELTVTTTKRVGFVGPFGGAALAMVADALGYQAAFEDMVRRALELMSRALTP